MVTAAPATSSAGAVSAAGEALPRLPPRVARHWIGQAPTWAAAAASAGNRLFTPGCAAIASMLVPAPMTRPRSLSLMPVEPDPRQVHQHVGAPATVAQLHHQVGPSGDRPRPGSLGQQLERLRERGGAQD